MTSDCFEKWRTKLDNINIPHQQRDIVNAAHDLASEKKLSQKLLKNLSLLKDLCHE